MLTLGGGPWLLAQAADGAPDFSTALLAYGVAAPFAGLCVWLLMQSRAENKELRAENGRLRDAQLLREQQLVAGLAPRVYDAALLYREAAGASAPVDDRSDRLGQLTEAVERLVSELPSRRSGAGGAGRGAGGTEPGDPGGTNEGA